MQKFVYKAVCLYYKIVKKIKRKMQIICDALNITNQKILIFDVLKIIKSAPLILPKLPRWNKPFRVLITNAGDWGWITDKSGFKYVKKQHQPTLLKQNYKQLSKALKTIRNIESMNNK